MRCIIVEDELPAISRLEMLLKKFNDIEIIDKVMDGKSAVHSIKKNKPDLVFLDINLPELNGFEVIKKLTYSPMIIFLTAYDEYAVKAFEENAIDYLLKPTNYERLKKSIDRAKERDKNNILEKIKNMIKEENIKERFSVKDGDEILIIPHEEVYYFKAQDKYTFLCTYDREFYFDQSLKNLEKILDSSKFLRIHKSYIVSVDKVKKLKKWFLRDYTLELCDKNKTSLKIGRSYLSRIKEKLDF
ncbi:DNA-binding response regulator [Tepiditoga spiralis]|uniref:DNA-binding response regulator n=1 Tax=Tepiditoga spiralis TaxID=2108365 RepID=A0A7G1G485_9BACT|nr:LytTR family DNA-binding domain-containing protein [Tepiditoga spiralis]BBE30026.1 DNA-binding response regulator [Tepiditoga spiralis]